MPMRSSSLANNPLAITRELDGRYDVVLQVRDNLDLITQVSGIDFAAILAELESAQDFTGITVVQGETVAWDAVNKILTVPKGDKGDKGDTGLTGPQGAQGIQGPQGIKGDTGLKGDTGSQGPKGFDGATGAQGPKGDAGDDLTITQITYNGNGTFNWLFSDGTTYVTPNLKGPKGDTGAQGVKGDQGVSVHHLKGTSTTQNEGDFAYPGEIDTYTFYPDANETYPLGWFRVRNGYDAYNYAIAAGYLGTEADFYLELANLRAYYEQVQIDAGVVDTQSAQVTIDAAQVAADKVIMEDARDVTVAAKDVTVDSADIVQTIFLGAKTSDPTIDNQGNPLVIGVMYYNTVSGTLRIYDGIAWTLGAFSVAGAVVSFNGRDGAVELTNTDITNAVGKDLTDAIKYSEADKLLTDVNKLTLSVDTNLTAGAGEITWSQDDRTANIGLGNGVVLQAGQEMMALVRNGTASTIAEGVIVMVTGSVGNSGKLVVAPYDGTSDASLIIGVTTESIANGNDGLVTSYGKVRGLNTSAWAEGTVLYVNGGGFGITETASLTMKIATVITSHITNGVLMVRVDGHTQTKEW